MYLYIINDRDIKAKVASNRINYSNTSINQ